MINVDLSSLNYIDLFFDTFKEITDIDYEQMEIIINAIK